MVASCLVVHLGTAPLAAPRATLARSLTLGGPCARAISRRQSPRQCLQRRRHHRHLRPRRRHHQHLQRPQLRRALRLGAPPRQSARSRGRSVVAGSMELNGTAQPAAPQALHASRRTSGGRLASLQAQKDQEPAQRPLQPPQLHRCTRPHGHPHSLRQARRQQRLQRAASQPLRCRQNHPLRVRLPRRPQLLPPPLARQMCRRLRVQLYPAIRHRPRSGAP